jgi:hypothetical protein
MVLREITLHQEGLLARFSSVFFLYGLVEKVLDELIFIH